MLDMKGICASSGSACTSGSLGSFPCTSWQSDCLTKSHMVLCVLTLSEETTKEDIDYVVDESERNRGQT